MAERPTTTMTVLRTDWLTPHLVRVVLSSSSFQDNGFTDKYVKIVFPQPGAERPTMRTYTVRWFDAAAGELAIDFVYHGDEGVAAPWAAAARPGDEIPVRGPGGAYVPSSEVDWYLLVGDESALPAIGAALEFLPAGASATVFALVEDEREKVKLESAAVLDVTWLYRSTFASAEQANTALVDAVRSAAFAPGSVHCFVHGEAGFVAELRRYLLAERGVPRELLSISGYWRRGKNEDGWRAEKAEMRRLEEEAAR